MSERHFWFKPRRSESVKSSYFQVTDSQSGVTWKLPWQEVFTSEIPQMVDDLTLLIKTADVDPDEELLRQVVSRAATLAFHEHSHEVMSDPFYKEWVDWDPAKRRINVQSGVRQEDDGGDAGPGVNPSVPSSHRPTLSITHSLSAWAFRLPGSATFHCRPSIYRRTSWTN